MQRYASHLLLVALVVVFTWLTWATASHLRRCLVANVRLDESSRALAESQAVLAQVSGQLKAQIAAGQFQLSKLLVDAVIVGLKMPEKPEPGWLKPRADGKCYEPLSGQRMHGVVPLRGACWSPALKIRPEYQCPDDSYDAPPEVASNPDLGNSCYKPFGGAKPRAARPGEP